MITVMTPTYNREKLLKRLYNSLLEQNNRNFEWLIVDDGSTDNTKTVVNQWINESEINIRYIYQENSGKAKAFNNGVINAKGNLFFCVDSDDYLSSDAIDIILSYEKEISDLSIGGILALKQDLKGNSLGDSLPENIKYADTFELSEKFKCSGEWSLIYKTDILKRNLFPEIENEKFITECVMYDKIAQTYKMLLVGKVITICEYQEDGYTGNIVKNMLANPTGYKIYYMQRIDMPCSADKRLGYIIRYNTFKILSKDKKYKYSGKYNFIVRLLGFTGLIGKIYYKYIMKK